uniref:Peptidase S1 domain-containing protein n=1 Tax=Steinernema glaseri TaxID=37863 RepID=A0A1I8AE46_9BILA
MFLPLFFFAFGFTAASLDQDAIEGIFGGQQAKLGEFPHHVFVTYPYTDEDGNLFDTVCGGSLITDRHVITAAHCVKESGKGQIMVGALDRTNSKQGQWKKIVGSLVHVSYNDTTLENDIAILQIEPVDLHDRNVGLIQIRRDDLGLTKNQEASVSGFGTCNCNVYQPTQV